MLPHYKADDIITIYSMPKNFNQSAKLRKANRNHLKIGQEFKRAANMLANRLASNGKTKNRGFSKELARALTHLKYEVFSKFDWQENPNEAFRSKNLVFVIRDIKDETPASQKMDVLRPIEKIVLPVREDTGERFLPISTIARISVAADGDLDLGDAGGSRKKLEEQRARGATNARRRNHIQSSRGHDTHSDITQYCVISIAHVNRRPLDTRRRNVWYAARR
jgi:hypothetical protein